MTTADWALVLSIFSFAVSLAGFVWNVWSKFIYPRAKVRAHIAVMLILDGDGSPPRRTITLTATNYGPTDIQLRGHQAKRRQGFLCFRHNRHLAFINPIDHPDTNRLTGWFAPGFPKKLLVGEGVTVYFAAEAPKGWVEEGDLYYFGFNDTFGRLHWCSRANAKKFREDVIEDFGAVPPKRESVRERARCAAARLWSRFSARVTAAAIPLIHRVWRKPR